MSKNNHLNDLINYYNHILEQGHIFWHCQAQDQERKRPYYYVQIHRTKYMSTCSNYYKLIELKKKIINIQKQLCLEVWPLRYKFYGDRMPPISVNDFSVFNSNIPVKTSL